MHFSTPWRAALLVLVLLAAIPFVSRSASRPDLLREVAQVASLTGTRVAPRLSVSPDDRSGAGGRTTAGPTDPEVRTIDKRLADARSDETSAEALYASALHNLIWARTAEQATRVVEDLKTVLRMQGPSAGVLSDLSAAHLVRAERVGTSDNLFEAVEAAAGALKLEPHDPAAHFNLALALHSLKVDGEAALAWRNFTRVDSTSGWAREASARLDSLSMPLVAPRPPPGASPAQLAAYAVRAPQEARLLALDSLLGTWGEAVLRGDTAAAADLGRAAAIAEALERRPGGDASVGDAVRAIRAHAADRATTRALATAHAAYARAQPYVTRRQTEPARQWLETALAHAEASPALAAWAAYWRGVALFYAGSPGTEAVFREIAARADPASHPALAGRARWSVGTLLLRRGAYADARVQYEGAARLFERAGERENQGAVHYLAGEALRGMGEVAAADSATLRTLHILQPYRASLWLHNLLYVAAENAFARGYHRTALHLQNEGVRVAAHIRPAVHAEALLVRARLHTAEGAFARATADAAESRKYIESLPAGLERRWLEADLQAAYAAISVRSRPARAATALDSVVVFFRNVGNTVRLLPLLVQSADAHLAAGDPAAAVQELENAAGVLDRIRGNAGGAIAQAAVLDAARGVFDRLVLLHARAGQNDRALDALERGRAAIVASTRAPTPASRTRSTHPGEIAVEYALIGDTLLTFTVEGTRIDLDRRVVKLDRMLLTAERVRARMELLQSPDSVNGGLATLYDELIRPVRARLRPGAPLVIVADGEIAGIPFAALRDSVRGRYLIQDHRVRFASTLAGAARRSTRRAAARESALFVADPAFKRQDQPGLSRLSGLAVDTRAIARGYPGAVVLSGADARPDTLAAVLGKASLFHFAGHAVFDDQRPGRSYLVLAPGSGGSGRLTAEEIARMDLRNLRLVVLSACQTQRSVTGRSGGFAGLSGAMLAAGAEGVVGSLWRVNDDLTRELMGGFHTAYRASGNGADALRQAQLRLLDSEKSALSSPSAWAGFRYAGN